MNFMDNLLIVIACFGFYGSARMLPRLWMMRNELPLPFWMSFTLAVFWVTVLAGVFTNLRLFNYVGGAFLVAHMALRFMGTKGPQQSDERGGAPERSPENSPESTPAPPLPVGGGDARPKAKITSIRDAHKPANSFSRHPFVAAAVRGDTAEVLKRIAKDEDLDQIVLGATPLMHAIEHRQHEVAVELIDHGADVTALEEGLPEANANSPIVLACLSGQHVIAQMLMQKGADPTVYRVGKLNLLDLVIKAGHKECEELLRSKGMEPSED